jgi:hypothetical protein
MFVGGDELSLFSRGCDAFFCAGAARFGAPESTSRQEASKNLMIHQSEPPQHEPPSRVVIHSSQVRGRLCFVHDGSIECEYIDEY